MDPDKLNPGPHRHDKHTAGLRSSLNPKLNLKLTPKPTIHVNHRRGACGHTLSELYTEKT